MFRGEPIGVVFDQIFFRPQVQMIFAQTYIVCAAQLGPLPEVGPQLCCSTWPGPTTRGEGNTTVDNSSTTPEGIYFLAVAPVSSHSRMYQIWKKFCDLDFCALAISGCVCGGHAPCPCRNCKVSPQKKVGPWYGNELMARAKGQGVRSPLQPSACKRVIVVGGSWGGIPQFSGISPVL